MVCSEGAVVSRVIVEKATVYYAPTRNRRYFTATAAARAEASAMMLKKYPTEYSGTQYGGERAVWHWTDEARNKRTHERLVRLIKRALP